MGDDGLKTGNRKMNKSQLRVMAKECLKKEKSLSEEENEAYIQLNFERIWKQHGGDDAKLIELGEAKSFI